MDADEVVLPEHWTVLAGEGAGSAIEVVREFDLLDGGQVPKKYDPGTKRLRSKGRPPPLVKRGPGTPEPAPDVSASPAANPTPTLDERVGRLEEQMAEVLDKLDQILDLLSPK